MGSVVPSRLTRHSLLAIACLLMGTGAYLCPNAVAAKAAGKSSLRSFPVPASARIPSEGNLPRGSTPKTSTTTFAPSGTSTTTLGGNSQRAGTPQSLLNGKRTTSVKSAKSRNHHGFKLPSLTGEALYVAVLAALLILACLAWAAARWLAFEPRWMLSTRHSMAEASYRMSATFAEFADWIRLGR